MYKAIWGLLGISILLNIVSGFVYLRSLKSYKIIPQPDSLQYLSPRIFLLNRNDIIINFNPLRTIINKYTDSIPEKFGVYFEYLPSGASIGVNATDSFILASLLKVPLAMAVYKRYEVGDLSRDQVLIIKKEDIDPNFGDLWKKGAETKITVNDAIYQMLVKSDNTAKNVLFHALPPGSLENVFDYLDIPKDKFETNAVVSQKNYSSILRSLYLSTFLAKENSNEILDTMTKSSFNDKLAAGIPDGVKISHKIGVHDTQDQNRSVYTDCGIIYVPKRPYILCLMSRSSEEAARKYMRDISKMVYDYVSGANER